MDHIRDYKIGEHWCLKCEATGCECTQRKRLVITHVDTDAGIVTFKRSGLTFPKSDTE